MFDDGEALTSIRLFGYGVSDFSEASTRAFHIGHRESIGTIQLIFEVGVDDSTVNEARAVILKANDVLVRFLPSECGDSGLTYVLVTVQRATYGLIGSFPKLVDAVLWRPACC